MTATFYVGDALEVMATLPAKTVDLVLSSPPFLALRSYLPADHPDKHLEGGSQATPGAYIDWLVDVAEACARILAPHGSMCIELGDTYAGSGGAGGDYAENGLREGQPKFRQAGARGGGAGHMEHRKQDDQFYTLQPGGRGWPLAKSLSLIPELFRLTLVYGTNPLTGRTTERWRLRNVIRWVRPNPPVGALGDKFRPATSELMVFCKSAKRYFDLDAVREPHKSDPTKFTGNGYEKGRPEGLGVGTISEPGNPAGAPPLDWWNIPPGGYEGAHYAVWPPELLIKPIKAMCPEKVCRTCGEPRRRIVDVSYDSNAASAWGGRGEWSGPRPTPTEQRAENYAEATAGQNPSAQTFAHGRAAKVVETLGFTDCGCPEIYNGPAYPGASQRKGAQLKTSAGLSGEIGQRPQQPSLRWRPGLVLDPFVGSGTTLAVATGHGRDAVGIDLDERNYALALERVGPLILQRGEVAA